MENFKQKFYEMAYPAKSKKIKLHGFLGFFYTLLRRFEIYREDVVYDLLPRGKRFLDIGCGQGNLVFKALSKFEYVTGIDIARTRLKKAEVKSKKLESRERVKVKFLVADADNKLPFEANSFDAVTMVATLEHFFDPYKVMEEIRRVLKQRGVVIIQVPNLGFLPRRLAVLFGQLPITSEDEIGWDGGHLHYFTVETLVKLQRDFKLDTEIITCSGVFAKLRNWWVSLLGADIIILARK